MATWVIKKFDEAINILIGNGELKKRVERVLWEFMELKSEHFADPEIYERYSQSLPPTLRHDIRDATNEEAFLIARNIMEIAREVWVTR